MARHILRLEVDFGHAFVIAGGETIEDLCQPLPRAPVDPAHDTKVDRDNGAVFLNKQVPLVHVSMEETGANRLGQEADDEMLRQCL